MLRNISRSKAAEYLPGVGFFLLTLQNLEFMIYNQCQTNPEMHTRNQIKLFLDIFLICCSMYFTTQTNVRNEAISLFYDTSKCEK